MSYELRIVKRKDRAFKVVGLAWIAERNFAWLGRYRRLSKDYELRVKTPEAMIVVGLNPEALTLLVKKTGPATATHSRSPANRTLQ